MRLITIVCVLMLAGCAHHHGHKHGDHREPSSSCMDKKWKEMDKNNDGKLSKDEYTAYSGDRFAKMDANKDGMVTPEEKKAYKDGKKEKCKSCK